MDSTTGMLLSAHPDKVDKWSRVEQNNEWHVIQEAAFEATDAFEGVQGWPQMKDGQRHWKSCMKGPAETFCQLVRAFGVEPQCALCKKAGNFDDHCVSHAHYKEVLEVVNEWREHGREQLWHETHVVGGILKFNHIDGQILGLRHPPEPIFNVCRPQELPEAGVWYTLQGPAAVCAKGEEGYKENWPNLWSIKHWKEKMEQHCRKIALVMDANGISGSAMCKYCDRQCISAEHLLGPKHFERLTARCPTNEPLFADDFLETWYFQGCCLAYNHLDGTLRMCRKPPEVEDAPAALSQEAPAVPAFHAGPPQGQPERAWQPPPPAPMMGQLYAQAPPLDLNLTVDERLEKVLSMTNVATTSAPKPLLPEAPSGAPQAQLSHSPWESEPAAPSSEVNDLRAQLAERDSLIAQQVVQVNDLRAQLLERDNIIAQLKANQSSAVAPPQQAVGAIPSLDISGEDETNASAPDILELEKATSPEGSAVSEANSSASWPTPTAGSDLSTAASSAARAGFEDADRKMVTPPKAAVEPVWQTFLDPNSGQNWYWNSITEESTFTPPADFYRS